MLQSKLSRLLLFVPLLLASCSSTTGPEGPPAPETTAVGGVLMIDGKPAPRGLVELKLYPKGREPKPGERIPICLVGPDGKYEFSSYSEGDGAVPGEYVLSVEVLRIGGPGQLFGPDKLLNNFNSPANADPRFQVTIVEGEPTEIPTIDIDTSQLKPQRNHRYATPAGKKRN